MRRPRGVTLLELVVAMALSLIVIGAAMLIFHLGGRASTGTAIGQSLAGALLIQEQIEADLSRLIVFAPCPVRFWPDRPDRLAFFACDPTGPSAGGLSLRGVRYSLDSRPGRLQREWAGHVESVGATSLSSIAFNPFLGPTGPLVRVTLNVVNSDTSATARPVVFSFLARLPTGRSGRPQSVNLLSGFLAKADTPGDQLLP